MVIPLTWDEDGITEYAFVTRAFYRGKTGDHLHMYLKGGTGFSAGSSPPSKSPPDYSGDLLTMSDEGTYRIVIVCFYHGGNELALMGIASEYDTGCPSPLSASSS